MITGKANYFNGSTSKPFEVQLHYSEKSNQLSFQDESNETLVWNLMDCEVELKTTVLIIRNEADEYAYLKVNDFDFIYQFNKQYYGKKPNFYRRFLALGLAIHLLLFVGIVGVILTIYFLFLPVFADKMTEYIPERYDNELGATFMTDFLNNEHLDSNKTNLLNQFKNQLELNNKKKIQIYVVKSSEVNAFAIPNGSIVVYSGILDKLNTSSELAALLGHEVTHINKRHSMRSLCKNLFGSILISTFFSDMNAAYSLIMDNVHTLQTLSYSREFEKEADAGSVEILSANGIPLSGIMDLLKNIENQKNEIPNFLSTHPISSERTKFNRTIIAKTPQFVINKQKEDTLTSIWKKIKANPSY